MEGLSPAHARIAVRCALICAIEFVERRDGGCILLHLLPVCRFPRRSGVRRHPRGLGGRSTIPRQRTCQPTVRISRRIRGDAPRFASEETASAEPGHGRPGHGALASRRFPRPVVRVHLRRRIGVLRELTSFLASARCGREARAGGVNGPGRLRLRRGIRASTLAWYPECPSTCPACCLRRRTGCRTRLTLLQLLPPPLRPHSLRRTLRRLRRTPCRGSRRRIAVPQRCWRRPWTRARWASCYTLRRQVERKATKTAAWRTAQTALQSGTGSVHCPVKTC